jgi:DNA transposition AAA+ family ATPase
MAVEKELKEAIDGSGLTRREIAGKVDRSYSTINSYLNGFIPLPMPVRKTIESLIREAGNKNHNSSGKRR